MSNSMYDLDTFIDDEAPITPPLTPGIRIPIRTLDEKISPKHYTDLEIEPWDYIIRNKMGYLDGNIVKYVSRYKKKGGREDLLKARTYLDKLLEITP